MTNIKTKPNGKIIISTLTSAKIWLRSVLIVLIVLTVYGFLTIETKGIDLKKAAIDTIELFKIMFGSPRGVGSHFGAKNNDWFSVLGASLHVLLVTLSLAFLTTLIGAFFALILGLLAAKNLTNKRVSNVIKTFNAAIRAVPTILWVFIFAIGAGLGSVAAVIGMSFHTTGYLLKAYSESFEELDQGTLDALKANGAGWIQIVFQAVLPSSITYILSWTFIRFEINFAVAVAMGAAAGAGGIGFQLHMATGYFYDFREIGYITYLILAVALVMEIIAVLLKKRYHLHE